MERGNVLFYKILLLTSMFSVTNYFVLQFFFNDKLLFIFVGPIGVSIVLRETSQTSNDKSEDCLEEGANPY